MCMQCAVYMTQEKTLHAGVEVGLHAEVREFVAGLGG